MAKLFLFGIGGTGSRVVRSLTMLLAAGVEIKNCDTVVPIIIDPDARNGDMNRTVELLKTYARLRRALDPAPAVGDFFHTDIKTLSAIAQSGSGDVKDAFVYDFGNINESFRDYLHYDRMPVESRHLVDLLFTPENLASPLTVGFKGSPNVGSVVLNGLMGSAEIQAFANNFNEQDGDRVFFISSIFGGTGAAGFPLLLKNLRYPDLSSGQRLPNEKALREAPMGGLTVLPYFKVNPSADSAIDSRFFITKTKAALSYYETNLRGLNSLYYLADPVAKSYDNQEGGANQTNGAHFIELVGALAVFDFMAHSRTELQGQELFFEYGLEKDDRPVRFGSLDPDKSLTLLGRALTRFQLFATFLTHGLPNTMDAVFAKTLQLPAEWKHDDFYRALRELLDNPAYGFTPWLKELAANDRAFAPFQLGSADYNDLVYGQRVETGFFDKGIVTNSLRKALDDSASKVGHPTRPGQFVELFSKVMRETVDSKIKGF